MEIVENLAKTTLAEIEKVLSTRTVVGEPIPIEGVTLIPHSGSWGVHLLILIGITH